MVNINKGNKKVTQQHTQTPMTILDVFGLTAFKIKEELGTSIAYLNKKRVTHKKFKPAGIDPTRGGEYLTNEQFIAFEEKVLRLNTEYETLQNILAPFEARVLPFDLFERIRKKAGLFSLEPSVYDNWYCVPLEGRANLSFIAGEIAREKKEESDAEYYRNSDSGEPVHGALILMCFALAVITLYWIVIGINYLFQSLGIFGGLFVLLSLSVVCYKVVLVYKNWQKKRRQKIEARKKEEREIWKAKRRKWKIERNVKRLKKIVPNMTLRNQLSEHREWIKELADTGKEPMIQVSILPPKDPKISDEMERVFAAIPEDKGWNVITVADPACIGYTLKHQIRQKPRHYDPGLVVRYKSFVAVIPATWYNITPLEDSFLQDIIKVAKHWSAKKFLLN